MGLKMTDTVRQIAEFFLKQSPVHIHEQWYKQPEARSYFEHDLMAILGGSDIMDKIMLGNSLADQANTIYLMGEMAMAGIHALGFPVGQKAASYEKFKPFFLKFFDHAFE